MNLIDQVAAQEMGQGHGGFRSWTSWDLTVANMKARLGKTNKGRVV